MGDAPPLPQKIKRRRGRIGHIVRLGCASSLVQQRPQTPCRAAQARVLEAGKERLELRSYRLKIGISLLPCLRGLPGPHFGVIVHRHSGGRRCRQLIQPALPAQPVDELRHIPPMFTIPALRPAEAAQ